MLTRFSRLPDRGIPDRRPARTLARTLGLLTGSLLLGFIAGCFLGWWPSVSATERTPDEQEILTLAAETHGWKWVHAHEDQILHLARLIGHLPPEPAA
jgi:hypothetical protein